MSLGEEPEPSKEYTISTICVVVVAAVVEFLLVAVITHKLTEHFVRKKLLESLIQSSDSTPDPCLVEPFFVFIVLPAIAPSAVNKNLCVLLYPVFIACPDRTPGALK